MYVRIAGHLALVILALACGCSPAPQAEPTGSKVVVAKTQAFLPARPAVETVRSAAYPQTETSSLKFGMSTALTGPAQALGRNMRDGLLTAFARANREGGIAGRDLELIVLDDGYEPSRTRPNMMELIDDEEVLAIVGNVGTPTAIAAVPVANEKGVAFYAAYTGAGFLRKTPPDRGVINIRTSYAEETGAMVDHLIKDGGVRIEEFAFFTQRDGYGDAGYSGGISALKAHGLKDTSAIAHGRYERNTEAVESGLATILQAEVRPRVVILVGAYAPCSLFIKTAREVGLEAVFLNVSFVGAQALAANLGDAGEGVIITQVVPHPASTNPLTIEYRNDLPAGFQPSFGSVEGYLAGRILVRALRQEGVELSRDGVILALESLGKFDMGIGESLYLSRKSHQALHKVWPTIIRDGQPVSYDWGTLRNHPALAR